VIGIFNFTKMEIWKDIKDYEGLYQVSNMGNVKSLARVTINKKSKLKNAASYCVIRERILKPTLNRGYYMLILCKNGTIKYFKNHRLVVTMFIGDIPKDMVVNHKNGIKTDNRLDNLEIVTACENTTHGVNRMKTSSKFSGVSWNKSSQRWAANICIKRKMIHIGYFNTEIEASKAYANKIAEIKRENKYTVSV